MEMPTDPNASPAKPFADFFRAVSFHEPLGQRHWKFIRRKQHEAIIAARLDRVVVRIDGNAPAGAPGDGAGVRALVARADAGPLDPAVPRRLVSAGGEADRLRRSAWTSVVWDSPPRRCRRRCPRGACRSARDNCCPRADCRGNKAASSSRCGRATSAIVIADSCFGSHCSTPTG